MIVTNLYCKYLKIFRIEQCRLLKLIRWKKRNFVGSNFTHEYYRNRYKKRDFR